MAEVKTPGLAAPVVDGVLQQIERSKPKTAEDNSGLGKDSFLKLLVAQMQNQDPLAPTSDTEWVSQMASFSSLEEMQNMSRSMTNVQAMNLVGQQVILDTKEPSGEAKVINGMVDFVTMQNGEAKLSVGGKLYSMDNLKSVLDLSYLAEKSRPTVEQKLIEIDLNDLKDIEFKVSFGTDIGKATQLAIQINGTTIDPKFVTWTPSGVVTVKKEGLAGLEAGKAYAPTVIFDNKLGTTITGDLVWNVTDSGAKEEDPGTGGEGTPDTKPEV